MIYVRSFRLAIVKCNKDYVKPCIRENNPDHVLFHFGTNGLDSKRQSAMTAKSILHAGKSIKINTCTTSISMDSPTERQI